MADFLSHRVVSNKISEGERVALSALGYKQGVTVGDLMKELNKLIPEKKDKGRFNWWVAEKNKAANKGKSIEEVLYLRLKEELTKVRRAKDGN